ncbi:MAG: indole-3-glycerol-phosphate synthase [Candidatus Walczuchella monophlebidarum]
MNILEKIITIKHKEVDINRHLVTIKTLEKSPYFERNCHYLYNNLKKKHPNIIAEFKRKSPTLGIINNRVSVKEVVKAYENAGASGISILTDYFFFYGQNEDLTEAREIVSLPLLCKDFIIDEYQIIAAKSLGTDIILLIAEVLSKEKIQSLTHVAKILGLEVLMEMHSEKEFYKINEYIDIIGINNRNLSTFFVDIQRSVELFKIIPNNFIKISESGLYDPIKVSFLTQMGFAGFLIGEIFMRSSHPGKKMEEYIKQVNLKYHV